MKLYKKKFSNGAERFPKINQMWHNLSVKEKLRYQGEVDEKRKKYSRDLQKWFTV